jgi:hypothetical protein
MKQSCIPGWDLHIIKHGAFPIHTSFMKVPLSITKRISSNIQSLISPTIRTECIECSPVSWGQPHRAAVILLYSLSNDLEVPAYHSEARIPIISNSSKDFCVGPKDRFASTFIKFASIAEHPRFIIAYFQNSLSIMNCHPRIELQFTVQCGSAARQKWSSHTCEPGYSNDGNILSALDTHGFVNIPKPGVIVPQRTSERLLVSSSSSVIVYPLWNIRRDPQLSLPGGEHISSKCKYGKCASNDTMEAPISRNFQMEADTRSGSDEMISVCSVSRYLGSHNYHSTFRYRRTSATSPGG